MARIPLFPIIKVASTCNLGCTYCSAEDYMTRARDSVMGPDVLEATLSELARVQTDPVYLWHGGEPLLGGRAFYERVLELQESFGLASRARNTIQSNGTLLTREWAEFFKANRFSVGISVDGTPEIHNRFRVFNNGVGTHERAMRGANWMQSVGRDPGVLIVVTRQSVAYPREIFSFLLECGLKRMDFKPCYGDSRVDVSLLDFAAFLKAVFDYWVELDDPEVRIRTLEGFIMNLVGADADLCSQSGRCAEFITVDHNGDVYPCDRFIKAKYHYGNLTKTPLDELVTKSDTAVDFRALIAEQRERCQSCSYASVCRGGCTHERQYWPEEYCQHRFDMIDHIREWLVKQGWQPVSVARKDE